MAMLIHLRDMNNPTNLTLYTQLMVFQNDQSREDFIKHNPDRILQRNLQALAHYLGLEYEYSLASRNARISRPVIPDTSYDFLNSRTVRDSPVLIGDGAPSMITGPSGSIGISLFSTQDVQSLALQDVGMSTDAFQSYK